MTVGGWDSLQEKVSGLVPEMPKTLTKEGVLGLVMALTLQSLSLGYFVPLFLLNFLPVLSLSDPDQLLPCQLPAAPAGRLIRIFARSFRFLKLR